MRAPREPFILHLIHTNRRYVTVSYTHLDVYKRQLLACGHGRRLRHPSVAGAGGACGDASLAENQVGVVAERAAEVASRCEHGGRRASWKIEQREFLYAGKLHACDCTTEFGRGECARRSGLSCMLKESGEDSVTSCFHARGNSGLLSVEELRRVCVRGVAAARVGMCETSACRRPFRRRLCDNAGSA